MDELEPWSLPQCGGLQTCRGENPRGGGDTHLWQEQQDHHHPAGCHHQAQRQGQGYQGVEGGVN